MAGCRSQRAAAGSRSRGEAGRGASGSLLAPTRPCSEPPSPLRARAAPPGVLGPQGTGPFSSLYFLKNLIWGSLQTRMLLLGVSASPPRPPSTYVLHSCGSALQPANSWHECARVYEFVGAWRVLCAFVTCRFATAWTHCSPVMRTTPPSYPFMSTPLSHPSLPSLTPRDRRSHHFHNFVILRTSYKWNHTVGRPFEMGLSAPGVCSGAPSRLSVHARFVPLHSCGA